MSVRLKHGCWEQGGGSLTARGGEEKVAPRVRVRQGMGAPRVSMCLQEALLKSAKNVYKLCLNARGTAPLIPTRVLGPPSGAGVLQVQPRGAGGGEARARECAWQPRRSSDAGPTLHNHQLPDGGSTCWRALDTAVSSHKWNGRDTRCLAVALVCTARLTLLSTSLHGRATRVPALNAFTGCPSLRFCATVSCVPSRVCLGPPPSCGLSSLF